MGIMNRQYDQSMTDMVGTIGNFAVAQQQLARQAEQQCLRNKLSHSDFKPLEFDRFRMQVVLKNSTLKSKLRVEKTSVKSTSKCPIVRCIDSVFGYIIGLT